MWMPAAQPPNPAVYAKTSRLGARGVTAFLIEKGMKGFSIARLDKLGMRGSPPATGLPNVEVPANVLGALNGAPRC
jgi:isovaleryl-CoA dehydrogenase